MSREDAPDSVLLGGNRGFPHWLHLRPGLHSIFRLQGSRCFSGLSTCHLSATHRQRAMAALVYMEERDRGDFHTLSFLPTVPDLSSFSSLLCNLKCIKHQNDLNWERG